MKTGAEGGSCNNERKLWPEMEQRRSGRGEVSVVDSQVYDVCCI